MLYIIEFEKLTHHSGFLWNVENCVKYVHATGLKKAFEEAWPEIEGTKYKLLIVTKIDDCEFSDEKG